MPKNPDAIPYFAELLTGLGEPGCVLCRFEKLTAGKYVDNLLWSMVNEPDVREELNRARGYCHEHAWMMERPGGALGVAIMMQGVLKVVLRAAEAHSDVEAGRSGWRTIKRKVDEVGGAHATDFAQILDGDVDCPVCTHITTSSAEMIKTLAGQIGRSETLRTAYRDSDGLCLPHYRKTLVAVRGERNSRSLIETQSVVWQRLHDELGEFIRKHDSRFHAEKFGVERDAWLRALAAISGANIEDENASRGITQVLTPRL